MSAVYPTTLPTFTTKTDKVDIVAASHINRVQEEIVAIATELGTSPSGTAIDLTTRLARLMDADGSVLSSNGFPTDTYPTQLFYRTDLETLYVRNSTNTGWVSAGNSLSNLVWDGRTVTGKKLGVDATGDGIFSGTDNSWYACAEQKYLKHQGCNTLKAYANVYASGNLSQPFPTAFFGMSCGTLFVSFYVVGTGPTLSEATWRTFPDLDISGIAVGSFCDIYIYLVGSDRADGAVNGSFLPSLPYVACIDDLMVYGK